MSEFTNAKRKAFEVGVDESKQCWRQWRQQRFVVVWPWLGLSILISLFMLFGIWVVASYLTPTQSRGILTFLEGSPWQNWFDVLVNNTIVLILHLLVCVAAYLARRSIPMQAKYLSGVNRFVHNHAGGIAMVAVSLMVIYSLLFQTWAIGETLNQVARTDNVSAFSILIRVAPHALVELTAVFLPLAACLLLGRQDKWNELLAAAWLCTLIAVPMLFVASAFEAFVAPLFFF